MSDIKRHKAVGSGIVKADPKGDLVLYVDYARLKAEVERMTERNDTLSMRYDTAWALINVQTSYIERLTKAALQVHQELDEFGQVSAKSVHELRDVSKGGQP